MTLGTEINASLDPPKQADITSLGDSQVKSVRQEKKQFVTNFIVRLRQLQSELNSKELNRNGSQPDYTSVQLAEEDPECDDKVFAMHNRQRTFKLSSRNAFFEVAPKIED